MPRDAQVVQSSASQTGSCSSVRGFFPIIYLLSSVYVFQSSGWEGEVLALDRRHQPHVALLFNLKSRLLKRFALKICQWRKCPGFLWNQGRLRKDLLLFLAKGLDQLPGSTLTYHTYPAFHYTSKLASQVYRSSMILELRHPGRKFLVGIPTREVGNRSTPWVPGSEIWVPRNNVTWSLQMLCYSLIALVVKFPAFIFYCCFLLWVFLMYQWIISRYQLVYNLNDFLLAVMTFK